MAFSFFSSTIITYYLLLIMIFPILYSLLISLSLFLPVFRYSCIFLFPSSFIHPGVRYAIQRVRLGETDQTQNATVLGSSLFTS